MLTSVGLGHVTAQAVLAGGGLRVPGVVAELAADTAEPGHGTSDRLRVALARPRGPGASSGRSRGRRFGTARALAQRQPDPRRGLHRRAQLDDVVRVVRDARLQGAGDRVAAIVQDSVLPLPCAAGRGCPGADAIREYSRNMTSVIADIFKAYQIRKWGLY